MVASLSDLGSSATTVAYFEREGYYAKNDLRHRRASFWAGEGAAALGLPKNVSPRTFERVLAGYVPGTEIRLGRARGGEHEHRPGLDLTLSAPKSVSLEALLYGNRQVLRAHDDAVRSTLDWVEAELLQTRGYDPATGRRPRVAADGLVAAGFRHLTSRDQDPQLHTHCVIANMTRNRAGEWRSVEPTEIRRNVKLIGAYYRQELARRLIGLGYRTETTMIGGVPGFEIAGYPRALLDTFSSRRREILAWLDEHGLPYSAALTQQAALITRKHKVDKDIDTLKVEWKGRAEGISHDRSLSRQDRAQDRRRSRETHKGRPYVRTEQELRPGHQGLSPREIVWRAVEHLAERASVIRESDIRAIALSHAPGRHELGEIDAAVTGMLADGHLVEATVRRGRSFVTGDALRSEREIVARMRDGIGAGEALTEDARVSERLDGTTLTEGQREAVRTILLSRDRIVAVQGAAGTGKTTMLREALGLMGERKAILLAPSSAAARVLADETGARARTLQWFLTRYGDIGNAQKMASARREHEGAVLVLDEASMTSTAQMELLMRISGRLRVARLVLVGDRGQLRAAGAGEPFRALQDAGIAMAEMDEILRQRDPGLKRAVEALQQGRAAEGTQELEVREVPHEELGAEAARLWLALDGEKREGTAILAPTHFIRAEIHRVVREGLAREGVLHGPELEIERYVNRHLTAAQRADVRNHEPGDVVIFHARVPPLRVDEGDACRIARAEGERVFLDHPSGRTVHIRPDDHWVRYRFGIYETARIRIRAGDRVRWTRNDKRHGLVNGGEAEVVGIDSRRVKFDLGGGKRLSLSRDDPQLRHIDHAWSTTVHGAQGMTRDAAIGVLDTGHGRLTGQAGLYVEASRARDRFVLVTDSRENLEEALEENRHIRMTALEAVGEDDAPPGPADATIGMLRELRDDWRALVAQAEAERTALDRIDGYARIVTGVHTLAAGPALPAEMQGFVNEVRQRDHRIVERRRDALAFVHEAEMHCRQQPLLRWVAEERGVAVSALPEHAAWRAEGAALEETGRQMQETPGFIGRIAAALGRIAQGFRLDEGERFCEAAAGHEAEAQRLGIDPGAMAGAARLVQRAEALGRHELPEAVRRTVEAWTPETEPPAPETVHRPTPDDLEAGRRIEAFLQDCRQCLEAAVPAAQDPDPRIDAAEKLRREGLRLLGEGKGAKLDDPARARLSRAADERDQVREAVDALGAEVQELRSRAFMELSGTVTRQGIEAHCDPADLPAWADLRARAEALRGEAGLAPEAREAVDAVLARAARVEAEIAPVNAFIEEGTRHLDLRAALDEGVGMVEPPPPDAVPVWRESSRSLRETALTLLGESPADTGEMQAAATRLADMPRLQASVKEVLDRLETVELGDEVADFRKLAATVEGRARRQETLPLHAEGYDQATAMAQTLTSRAALPEAARHEAAAWLDRDRGWNEELAAARKLTASQEQDAGMAGLSEVVSETLSEALPEALRETAHLPAVRSAIGQETALLARSAAPEQWTAWAGDEPLVAGDRIAWRAGETVHQAVVAFPGETGGVRASDTLLVRIVGPADGTAPGDAGRIVEIHAQALHDVGRGCARAEWSDEGLRQLEAARQYSVPSAACPLACPEPVAGDRIAWTEAAGRSEEVRTVEAVVATRTGVSDEHELGLRVIGASGPEAPDPGASITRTADEVTARGCYRAAWSDEARREAELAPQKEVEEKILDLRRSRGGGISM